MAKRRLKFWQQSLLALLAAIGGWALFDLFRVIFETILVSWGLTDVILQRLILISFVAGIFLIVGYSWKRAAKTLTG